MIRALAFASLLAACKSTGTLTFKVDASACDVDLDLANARVQLFVVAGDLCAGACAIPTCDEDCTWVCDDCESEAPIDFEPPAAGTYGIYVRYHDAHGALLAAGCTQATFEADGTSSERFTLTLGCCGTP